VIFFITFLTQATMAQALPSVSDATIEISQRRLTSLDMFARAQIRDGQVGNISYGLWQRGALLQTGSYGPVQPQGASQASDETIYQIYSMTKPVTAVGMLILYERGHFELDDPITTVLPEFSNIEVVADYDEEGRLFTYLPPNPPTFRQLLGHTAGFAYQSIDRSPIDRKYIALDVANAPTGDALVSRVASVPLMRTPGSEWHYSLASDLQGVVIERLTGETLQTFLKREIFDRLAMHDTGFFVPDEHQSRVSSIATLEHGKLTHERPEDLSQSVQEEKYFEGGHGLVSTLADYHRFLEMLRRGGRTGPIQILRPESVELMTANAIQYKGTAAPQRGYGSQSGLGYGFGVSVVENPEVAGLSAPKGTFYWYGALGTWFWVDPLNEIVFVGMIQTRAPVGPDMLAATMESVYGPISTQYRATGSSR
jgi:CubicO group peptidase (beta-lactamase class C family)